MRHLVAGQLFSLILSAALLASGQEAATSPPESAPTAPAPAPTPPEAEETGPTAVAIIATGGEDVPASILDQVRQAATWLVSQRQDYHGREAREERDPGLALRASGCADDACLVAVGQDAQSAYLMLFLIERQEVGGQATVLLVDVAGGQTVGSAAFALPSDAAQFNEAMAAPMGPLLEAISSIYPQTGTLTFSFDQEGASVTLDGEPVGTSPVEPIEEVEPGDHVVRAELAGYLPFEQTVTVVAGETAAVEGHLEVEPPPPPPPPPPTPIYRRWWLWTIVGAVVVGTSLGLGLGLGIDTSPEYRQYQNGVEFPSWERR